MIQYNSIFVRLGDGRTLIFATSKVRLKKWTFFTFVDSDYDQTLTSDDSMQWVILTFIFIWRKKNYHDSFFFLSILPITWKHMVPFSHQPWREILNIRKKDLIHADSLLQSIWLDFSDAAEKRWVFKAIFPHCLEFYLRNCSSFRTVKISSYWLWSNQL